MPPIIRENRKVLGGAVLTITRRSLNLYEKIKARYEFKPVLSYVLLLRKESAQSGKRGMPNCINITVFQKINKSAQDVTLRAIGIFSQTRVNLGGRITLESLLKTNNALHHLIGALWQVYNSNNLELSQSFFQLIRLVSEHNSSVNEWRHLVIPAKILRRAVHSHIEHTKSLRSQILEYRQIKTAFFGEYLPAIKTRLVNIRNILPMQIRHTSGVRVNWGTEHVNNWNVLNNKNTIISKETQSIHRLLFTQAGGLSPILQQIYEGIEANSLFYNSSSYRSAKTLIRLTNSLWKVYRGQNLELSRSFTRLISHIADNHITQKKDVNIFSRTESLKNLVSALRQAFSGNNLELRHSLISLVSDIHEAGITQNTNKYQSILMLYRLFLPQRAGNHVTLRHAEHTPSTSFTAAESNNLNEIERLLDKKLKTIGTKHEQVKNEDDLIKTISERLKKDRQDEWRMEKLQRGLM